VPQYLSEIDREVETIRVSDELVVDLAPDGTVYGIELLNANQQLQREHMGKLLVINEATGERTELPPCRSLKDSTEGAIRFL